MAEGDKPYRRYKGGRVKGRVPLNRGKKPAPAAKSATPGGPRKPRRWGRWVALTLVGLLVFLLLWGVLGYLSFSSGVDDANSRLPRGAERQLVRETGSMLSDPSTILVIGTDGGKAPGRQDARRSDSLLLIRTEPSRHRISYLSIPRDLRVDIPGYGSGKINAANQFGGPALTIATVRALTGLKVDHVVVFDFDGFRELIDAIGGVEIDVPQRIQSNAFDCPYKPARCETWDGWRFAKGNQHMDGRRALVYSRIRKNELNPADNDVTRVGRQQAVADAVGDRVASVGTFFKLPFVGDSLAAPLVTDLSAWELAQLGWVRFRADSGSSLHCRLGGEPSSFDGESVLLGSEDNVEVIAMFLRASAPLAPRKGELYAPGCTRRAR
jgi:polyisoprenyl-teichoic acid--peptidoglycan teichoic acid transferase